jgi:hypothetical protein
MARNSVFDSLFYQNVEITFREIKWSFSVFLGNMLVALRYVWSDMIKNKKSFFIGFTTVLVVVFAVAYFLFVQFIRAFLYPVFY